ncbi:MAG: glucan 1,3-beta-glucosidase [Gammaproteobacteria bacterium]|jgi:exo-beta-1,3-glucanase (GH17 family)|nr:glucan 1,3-beta-glucosidase [Gammaproteobacteria bacterium]MBU0771955.1 glucan 1,3-beta-glucosidase [Gammaproteobacteria bacterium]MBU0855468.1 glucan 1,3-beta-glucosidase [Gammaproteobacteria bacterium]MBU1845716.1 glucan 1,3-beta-glucosidase [Gammaproteobacteria bacterium]
MTSSSPRAPRWARYALVHVLALALIVLWLWQRNQPQSLADVPPDASRLQCVSYAPYYRAGESPLVEDYRVSRERIDADLERLSKISGCVRLYSVDQGLDQVPQLAAQHGLKVLLGAWIGGDAEKNDAELSQAIALANRYGDVVRGLIVGNEVLLRREQTADAMAEYLERARRETTVPVTYADVWEFWLKNAGLAQHVDFVTVHILPYWEDAPQPVDGALAHVESVMERVQAVFDKPLLIGETGWPSEGKQRDGARPGLIEQARFLREFLIAAEAHGWRYNIIEAFDQPWKRQLEGTVGGFWGVLDSDGRAKFAWHGDIAERRDSARSLFAGAAGLAVAVLLALLARLRRSGALAAYGLSGAFAGVVAPLQFEYLTLASRNGIEWAALGAVAAAGWLAWAALPFVMAGRGRRWMRAACRALLFALAYSGLVLAVDGRYRDFPFLLFLLPVVLFGVAAAWARFDVLPPLPEARLFALIAVAGAVLAWLTDWRNPQALAWAVLTVVLAGACVARARRSPDVGA